MFKFVLYHRQIESDREPNEGHRLCIAPYLFHVSALPHLPVLPSWIHRGVCRHPLSCTRSPPPSTLGHASPTACQTCQIPCRFISHVRNSPTFLITHVFINLPHNIADHDTRRRDLHLPRRRSDAGPRRPGPQRHCLVAHEARAEAPAPQHARSTARHRRRDGALVDKEADHLVGDAPRPLLRLRRLPQRGLLAEVPGARVARGGGGGAAGARAAGSRSRARRQARLGPRRLHPFFAHQPGGRRADCAAFRAGVRVGGGAPPHGPRAGESARLQRGHCRVGLCVVPQYAQVWRAPGRRRRIEAPKPGQGVERRLVGGGRDGEERGEGEEARRVEGVPAQL